MTEAEIVAYLGLPADTRLCQCLIDGMAETPIPIDTASHIRAFRDFLRVAGKPGECTLIRREG